MPICFYDFTLHIMIINVQKDENFSPLSAVKYIVAFVSSYTKWMGELCIDFTNSYYYIISRYITGFEN